MSKTWKKNRSYDEFGNDYEYRCYKKDRKAAARRSRDVKNSRRSDSKFSEFMYSFG